MKSEEIVGKLAAENVVLPDVQELLAHIHLFLGGTKEYARMVAEDVRAATPGSNPRLAFHNNYMQSVAKFGGDDELAARSLDDLKRTARELLREVEGEAADGD